MSYFVSLHLFTVLFSTVNPVSVRVKKVYNCLFYQSLLIISPVTRCAATWPLVLELKLFLSNNVRMSKATEMCLRDHNSNNCTHRGNICYCTYLVNNDYDKFRSFSRLYMTLFRHRTCTRRSRQIFSFSLQWPGGSTQ